MALSKEEIAQLKLEAQQLRKELEAEVKQLKIDSSTFEDVRSPIVSFKDRALVKNLGANLEEGAKYLKRRYPDAEVITKDGNIFIKGKDETSFKALDPSSYEGEDITDIAGDVASGIGQGFLTAAAAPTSPLGMAAVGSAANVSAEALRQKLGQMLGVNENMDQTNLGVAGAAGIAAPIVGQIADDALPYVKKGLESAAVSTKDLLQKLGHRFAGFRNLGDFETYLANKQEVKTMADQLKDVTGTGIEKIQKRANDILEATQKKLKDRVASDSETYNRLLDNELVTVDLPAIKNLLEQTDPSSKAAELLRQAEMNIRTTVPQAKGAMGPTVFTKTAYGQSLPDIEKRVVTSLSDAPTKALSELGQMELLPTTPQVKVTSSNPLNNRLEFTESPIKVEQVNDQFSLFAPEKLKMVSEPLDTQVFSELKNVPPPTDFDAVIGTQEALPIDLKQYLSGQVQVPGKVARGLKQELQALENYASKSLPVTAKGSISGRSREVNEAFGAQADAINRSIRSLEEGQAFKNLDEAMQQRIVGVQGLERMKASPLASLSTESLDNLANIQRWSALTGDDALALEASKLRGAKSIIGATDRNPNYNAWRALRNAAMRGIIEGSEQLPAMAGRSVELPVELYKNSTQYVPYQVWQNLLINSSQKETK